MTTILFLFAYALAQAARQPLAPEVTAAAVLGIEMGMPIEAVREVLRPLGVPDSRPTREGGTKEVWRLNRTGFAWMALKADNTGRLVWLTGHRRSGNEVAFDSVGGTPQIATDDTAMWHTTGREAQQRLTLRGRLRAGQVVTLAAVR
jgi:hypothetical protein